MQVYKEALTQEQIQAIQQQTEAVGEYVTVGANFRTYLFSHLLVIVYHFSFRSPVFC